MCYLLYFFLKMKICHSFGGRTLTQCQAVGSGGVLAILTNHEQRKTKILYDYEHVDPADGVEPPQRLYRARDGVGIRTSVASR